jgi:ferrochelatase
MNKKAVLLVNVGTPDAPNVKSVRRFLSEFLNDPLVIDIPWLLRKVLVNLIIVPFRAKKSTEAYKRLWTPEGSPLLVHLQNVKVALQKEFGNSYYIFAAMRYGNPSIASQIREIKKQGFKELIVLPLYPQYATSTTQSVIDRVSSIVERETLNIKLRFIDQFYQHKGFIEAFTQKIASYTPSNYDHIVFSYHGLPLRQVNKNHPKFNEDNCHCESFLPEHGHYCYKATCYETTRLLAAKLGIHSANYSVAFQSRLSKNWLQPFLDEILLQLLNKGKTKILVVAPSFVADCLETIVEIDREYKQMFLNNGGEGLAMVESLNTSSEWIMSIKSLIQGALTT